MGGRARVQARSGLSNNSHVTHCISLNCFMHIVIFFFSYLVMACTRKALEIHQSNVTLKL